MEKADYDSASEMLERELREVERIHLRNERIATSVALDEALGILFESNTQAYREVLLGCVLIRLLSPEVSIRKPYAKMGEDAWNGRSLDERVVNPFLRRHRFPSSKGPYLNVFRRSVQFVDSTRDGLRDKAGYDAFLSILTHVESLKSDEEVHVVLRLIISAFVSLREASDIPLSRINRISLRQCEVVIGSLLKLPSGGRIPVYLVASTFHALNSAFGLSWEIDCQGINVADQASGAGGDLTIRSGGRVLLSAEVTERPVDESRLMTIFDAKIAPGGLDDYLFFLKDAGQAAGAVELANRYFTQGHEVNFMEIRNWIVQVLSITGAEGRAEFLSRVIDFLDDPQVPKSIKTGWNEVVASVMAGSPA